MGSGLIIHGPGVFSGVDKKMTELRGSIVWRVVCGGVGI